MAVSIQIVEIGKMGPEHIFSAFSLLPYAGGGIDSGIVLRGQFLFLSYLSLNGNDSLRFTRL
jgi:hypothetical protein